MKSDPTYPIGNLGQKWQQAEREAWLAQRTVGVNTNKKLYRRLKALADRFDIEQYGALSYDENRFPLFAIKSKNWDESKPMVTGGVHGYENQVCIRDQIRCNSSRKIHGALQHCCSTLCEPQLRSTNR